MPWKRDKLFCDINPTCYAVSVQKEICKRHIKNFLDKDVFAKTIIKEELPNVVFSHSSNMIKRAEGINLQHQINKAVNIKLASSKISGMIIRPGEVFSFWKAVGKISKKKGYMEGRILHRKKLTYGLGGGLCNLANTIHLLILHSPLEIIEIHKHSDALAPDEGKRIPFSSGTSIVYNNIDYRFKNNTDQNVQLFLWCEGEILYAELRSEKEFPWCYKLIEENHHFKKEQDKYYRISKIYKETYNKEGSGETAADILEKELVWDNRSEVLYDYALIPEDQIRE